jgi:hypothetical protein
MFILVAVGPMVLFAFPYDVDYFTIPSDFLKLVQRACAFFIDKLLNFC